MDKIIYKLVYDRKKALNKRGVSLVQVEAYLNKKKKYFSTKVYLRPDQWDHKRLLIKNHPNADALNRFIYDFIAMIEKKELELWQQGKLIDLDSLKNALFNRKDDGSFITFFKQEIMTSSLKDATKKNYCSTLVLLQKFKGEIKFVDLTYDFVASFEAFLLSNGYHINTIAKHMKHLKKCVNIAINKEYIDVKDYAFRKYRIKMIEGRHTYLSFEELTLLEKLDLNDQYFKYKKTLDAFLFCCYTGMRYSDFISLSSQNVIELYGDIWIVYKSIKTRTEVRLPLYLLFGGKGLNILNNYKDQLNIFFSLHDNSNVNKDLGVIAKLAGITQNVSFHTARHTNATLLIYNGINITTVQKLLGHKSVRTTQIYANIMDMTIVHDLEKSIECNMF